MPVFVPSRVRFGVSKPECTAKVNHLGAGLKKFRSEFERNLRGRGKENETQAFGSNGFRSSGDRLWRFLAQGGGTLLGIGSMLEENEFDAGMAAEDFYYFSSAIPAEPHDTDRVPL
jgi:hypothetical protein